MKTDEYWKIKELKNYLLTLAKEDKLRCEVTRSEENDVVIKIKLMQEAEKYGRQSKEKEMLDLIKQKNDTIVELGVDLEHKEKEMLDKFEKMIEDCELIGEEGNAYLIDKEELKQKLKGDKLVPTRNNDVGTQKLRGAENMECKYDKVADAA